VWPWDAIKLDPVTAFSLIYNQKLTDYDYSLADVDTTLLERSQLSEGSRAQVDYNVLVTRVSATFARVHDLDDDRAFAILACHFGVLAALRGWILTHHWN
jgi:hypothetical protein